MLVIEVPRSACMICGTVHLEDLLHQFPCQNTGFVTVDVDTDDVTGADVDHHVRIEVDAFHRACELGDVPPVLPAAVRDADRQVRAGASRIPKIRLSDCPLRYLPRGGAAARPDVVGSTSRAVGKVRGRRFAVNRSVGTEFNRAGVAAPGRTGTQSNHDHDNSAKCNGPGPRRAGGSSSRP